MLEYWETTPKVLQSNFDAKKDDFSQRRIPDGQIYAFHATDPSNIDNILRKNLNYNKTVHGRRHGDGCYFSGTMFNKF
jgi:hypothetical protein